MVSKKRGNYSETSNRPRPERPKAGTATDKEPKRTLKCAWKSFEGTFCPEAERLLKAQKEENDKLKSSLGLANSYVNKYSQALTEIRQLLSDALDSDVTSADESIDNMYEALELCDVLDE